MWGWGLGLYGWAYHAVHWYEYVWKPFYGRMLVGQ